MKPEERDDALEGEAVEEAPAPNALEEMLEDAAPEVPARLLPIPGVTTSLVGEIVDDKHPALRGRVRVRWTDLEGQLFEKWLPTLQGLPVRVSDRVLLMQPSNWPEPVVMGVLDGFARRPEVERDTKASLELKRDEAIRVRSQSGDDLLEVFEEPTGPVVRLLSGDVDLDVQGKMRIRADAITLEARKGQARIEASDDVVVRGETVHLN
ncbi:MAG: hypothetical protein H6719_21825 [Sandaracinaceae bacterium]|nr:hypothetical protein [Sandaracinaceae bacterium]